MSDQLTKLTHIVVVSEYGDSNLRYYTYDPTKYKLGKEVLSFFDDENCDNYDYHDASIVIGRMTSYSYGEDLQPSPAENKALERFFGKSVKLEDIGGLKFIRPQECLGKPCILHAIDVE
jgi:hypothetical protein